jgi:hypothetical protein
MPSMTGLQLTFSRSAFALALLGACSCDHPSAGRKLVTLTSDTAWIANVANGQMLYEPVSLAAADSTIFVLEWSGRQIVALNAHNGSVRWRAGRKGVGPGEFNNPYDLRPVEDGGVVVFDAPAKRLTRYSADGSINSIVPLSRIPGMARWMCALRDKRYLLGFMYSDTVMEVDEQGTAVKVSVQPWQLEDPRTDLNEPPMYNDPKTHTCISTFVRALGFSRYDASGFGPVRPYVENLVMPYLIRSASGRDSLNVDVIGAYDAAIRRDTLWLLFGGVTDLSRRVVDLYSTESGRYLVSVRLPKEARAIAVTGNALVVIVEEEDGSKSVLALRRGATR